MANLPQGSPANPDSKPYWEAALEGRLVFKKCSACGHVQFPPRHLCPNCWSDQASWIESKGRGRIESFCIVHRAPTPAFASRVPYVIAMIALDDAPRMMANIVGDGALEAVIGDAVEVEFERRDGYAMPQFHRVKS
jgi:uncharacterized OB-fold protein